MKTDSIFYRIFKNFPGIFFELIGEQPEAANRYRFDSCELKETAFRIDGLFMPIEKANPIYFVEVQFRHQANFYAGFFAEVFIYLNQNDPSQEWRGIIIYGSRRFEPKKLTPYQGLLNSSQVRRIYLDELPKECFQSLRMRIIEFIISDEEAAVDKGHGLLSQVEEEVSNADEKLAIIDLIETIMIYKFSQLTREELRQMFDLDDLRKTRIVQEFLDEGRQEGKLEVIPALLQRGFTVEEIATIVNLELDKVRLAVEKSQEN